MCRPVWLEIQVMFLKVFKAYLIMKQTFLQDGFAKINQFEWSWFDLLKKQLIRIGIV